MDLILWRHAEAEPGEPDLGRRLTSKGMKQAERMAAWLEHRLPETTRILVSPSERTRQTAHALGRKFRISPDVAPGASAASVLAAAGWPDARPTPVATAMITARTTSAGRNAQARIVYARTHS